MGELGKKSSQQGGLGSLAGLLGGDGKPGMNDVKNIKDRFF